MASTVTELLRRRFGGKKADWEEITLTYTAGHSFTLMGVTFAYDTTNNVYKSDGTFIYPNELILTLDSTASTAQAYNVLMGGDNTQNEIWMGSNNQIVLAGIRFQNNVTRNLYTVHNVPIYEIHLTELDKSILLNGEPPARGGTTYAGAIAFNHINGRVGSYHTDCNKVLKVKVR